MKKHSEIIHALAIIDPLCVIIKRKPQTRKWTAWTTAREWRCTSNTRREAIKFGQLSQCEIMKRFTREIRVYCGRTGKRLA